MNTEEKEVIFVARIKENLDEALLGLDPAISDHLRRSRKNALKASEKTQVRWLLPASGFAAASIGLLALFFLLRSPKPSQIASESVQGSLEDLELLTGSETIEFYDDLEFYGWLAEQNLAG